MAIIVQKFGGTSVADSQKILSAARKAIRAQREGHQVIMVVSAMGKNTDMLVNLAQEISESPSPREMDMLLATGEQVSVALMAMAIHSLGHEAESMTGAQLGIRTDSSHTKARIQSISAERIHKALDQGKIVIAAGFQGVDEEFNITTLGRGGSDTTAVALAAAVGASTCEIYTDVDGIYTTDPRVLPEARRLARISYEEMLELASAGAGVMHNRSIEFAHKYGVPVHVRSSFSDSPGTMIGAEPESPDQPVCGAAIAKNEARVTINGVPDRPGAALSLFSRIAAKNVALDMIVQNVSEEGLTNMSFTILREDLPAALGAVERMVKETGADSFSYDDDVSVVSVVGLGMATQPGVAERMFRAIADEGINILMITTSEIKISILVNRDDGPKALKVVHNAFRLEQEPEFIVPAEAPAPHEAKAADTVATLRKFQSMESLIIHEISLDDTEARISLFDVPDEPGLAARLFERIGAAGIVVDMIVQSIGHQGRACISFTVPHHDLEQSVMLTRRMAEEFGYAEPAYCPHVAKLSVCGIGMRSHTGVARRMFHSLSDAGINVEMINTSEVRINVVVDRSQGEKALAVLKEAFADAMI